MDAAGHETRLQALEEGLQAVRREITVLCIETFAIKLIINPRGLESPLDDWSKLIKEQGSFATGPRGIDEERKRLFGEINAKIEALKSKLIADYPSS